MALNIKNAEVEKLAKEVSELTGENKTEAIRRALADRRARVEAGVGGTPAARLLRFLETELWPAVPEAERGHRLAPDREDAILGYGPHGV